MVATSKPQKDWLPERWAEVVDALHQDFGLQPVLVGGRSERELAAERVIMERARHKPVSALGKMRVMRGADRLRRLLVGGGS